MDILIKNMELPKTENDNFMVIVTPTGVIDVVENGNGFMIQKKYEAVALPEHGRLISDTDVKALLHSGLSLDTDSDMDYVCGLIDELPTIVEATE